MSAWGRLVGSTTSTPVGWDPNAAGWRDDPKRPGIQLYWTGNNWDAEIGPRAKPDPIWRAATSTALGVLMAAATLSVFWRFLA
jgi:hypothetical protein